MKCRLGDSFIISALGELNMSVKDAAKWGVKWSIHRPWDAYRAGQKYHLVVALSTIPFCAIGSVVLTFFIGVWVSAARWLMGVRSSSSPS